MSNGVRRRKATPRQTMIGTGIFAVVGVIAIGVAVVLGIQTAGFMANAERTEGAVRGVSSKTTTNYRDGVAVRKKVFTATVFFSTAEGERVSFETAAGSRTPDYETGDSVPVAYDPDNPADARIATLTRAYATAGGVGAMGLSFVVVSAFGFVMARRRAATEAPSARNGTVVGATHGPPTAPHYGGPPSPHGGPAPYHHGDPASHHHGGPAHYGGGPARP
jgi:hypothetical protein